MKKLKKFLPKKLINFIKRIIPNKKNKLLKKLKFSNSEKVINLGSDYGGWFILDSKNLENRTINNIGINIISIISRYFIILQVVEIIK